MLRTLLTLVCLSDSADVYRPYQVSGYTVSIILLLVRALLPRFCFVDVVSAQTSRVCSCETPDNNISRPAITYPRDSFPPYEACGSGNSELVVLITRIHSFSLAITHTFSSLSLTSISQSFSLTLQRETYHHCHQAREIPLSTTSFSKSATSPILFASKPFPQP